MSGKKSVSPWAKKTRIRPNKKKVSASANPTDRVLKRRPNTFFLTSRPILFVPALCVRGQLRRQSQSRERSRRVIQKSRKGEKILTVDHGL